MTNTVEGRYANCFDIGHNAFEFVIDCGQCYSDTEISCCHTRIITNPVYAEALMEALSEALMKYREKYGEISEPDQLDNLIC